ncbi:MAG TPA: lysophospholipid acyltransferase family protein [Solirubrobacteraceae bacterium]|nr:lysophospholipid acyltransferase family protein [Solirubrobacteraceae bacterium]
MTAGLLAYVARAVSGASVRFTAGLPGPGQRVFFANHCSHLDFLVIWSSLPPVVRAATRPVAAAEYWLRGRLRRHLAANVFRAVLIDRGAGGREAVARLSAALAEGDSLILFPEGTRGEGPHVAPFKSGLFHLAQERPGLELVPVHLENLNRVLPKGEAMPVPVMSRVSFGAPLRLEPGEDKDAFLERTRAAVVGLAA